MENSSEKHVEKKKECVSTPLSKSEMMCFEESLDRNHDLMVKLAQL